MDWKEKVKEKLLEHSVAAVLALTVLLLSVIWLAVPSEVWGTASAVVPKRVIWALLGLAALTIVVLAALLLDSRRNLKHTSAALREAQNVPPPAPPPPPPPAPTGPRYFKVYGLFWDDDLNPYCTADETLLFVYTQAEKTSGGKYDYLRCPKCKVSFPLRHETYGLITLPQAQQSIREAIDTA